MTTALSPRESIDPAIVERVLLHGDLKQLSPAQKISYYRAVCESVGLNPLTQPFQYLVLNGREVLYALRGATDQLRALHQVSVTITAREAVEDCFVVTAKATLPSGRTDETIGAVPIAGLRGEARANALMKAETKAKRRVTLAIVGLGMLDETEVQAIEAAAPPVEVDHGTGEEVAAEEVFPPPAPGFYHVKDFHMDGEWYTATLLRYRADGTSVTVSTKQPGTGKLLKQAADMRLAIKPDLTFKQGRKDEAYLNMPVVFYGAQPEGD
jgi:hypothetical protein